MRANFTPRTQEILSLAKKLARKFNHEAVHIEHILFSLIKADSFVVPFLELHLNTQFTKLEDSLHKYFKFIEVKDSNLIDDIVFSSEVKSCLDYSISLSNSKQHNYISVEHIFSALINDLNSNAIDYFIEADIDILAMEDLLNSLLDEDIVHSPIFNTEDSSIPASPKSSNGNQTTLESYGVNFNTLAKSGKFDFVFPNQNYIHELESTLCRKNKSCAVLVGDAGVGKTALVEGLAKRIVNLDSNDYLINKTIISMDLNSMVAGTKYRGQFEERLKFFIDEVTQHKHIILFIDEIHTIVGAGNSEGALDAANILKPYISRGEITCIGSTTHEEYRKSFGKDAALKRRFHFIHVKEPTESETLEIIGNLIPSYSSFHNINYSLESIKESIHLSNKFIHNKKLPDKAIDLLDQAGSNVKIKFYKKPQMAKQIEKSLTTENIDSHTKNSIYEQYKTIMDSWSKKKLKKIAKVQPIDVRRVISKQLDIPIESLNETYSNKILKLSNRMSKDVIGQEQAVEKIVNSLFKTHCGLSDEFRPIGSFLFLGKTGVGKTLTAKSLANHYFGSHKKLIYFDMSEFSDSVSVNKFSGSSPGYVGYENGGILTEKIKKDPHSVLLFDEIEKAHPVVLQSLLQILEEGRLTDNTGEETSFKNTIIILTSNLGADIIDKKGSVGFMNTESTHKDKVFEEAKRKLSPELVNRFDGIVLFNNFKDSDLKKIINIELKKVSNKLSKKGIKSKFLNSLKLAILDKTISENLGGRPIRRIIQNEVEVEIAKFLINKNVTNIKVSFSKGNFLCHEL